MSVAFRDSSHAARLPERCSLIDAVPSFDNQIEPANPKTAPASPDRSVWR
jgi:hypothetical protein